MDDGSLAEDPLDRLRRQIGALERTRSATAGPGVGAARRLRADGRATAQVPVEGASGVPLGLGQIDGCFQGGGLPFGLHEATPVDGAAPAPAMGFALMLMARTLARRREGRGLIVQSAGAEREGGGLYGPGLAALGLDTSRLALVRVRRPADALQVLDEALRSGAVTAAIAEVEAGEQISLAASQRFNFWAQDHESMAFIVALKPSGNSAAMTRWQVAAAPSEGAVAWARRRGLRRPRLGGAGLELVLRRNRRSAAGGGLLGRWIVEWDGEDCCFRTPEALPASVAGTAGHRPDAAVA